MDTEKTALGELKCAVCGDVLRSDTAQQCSPVKQKDFRADTRNSPETSMAVRNQQPGNRSRLGVPCLLERARAEPRTGALTALHARSNST